MTILEFRRKPWSGFLKVSNVTMMNQFVGFELLSMQTPVCYICYILFPVCSQARVYQIRDWMIGQHYENNIKMQMQMFEAFQVSALCPVSISSYEL